MKLIRKTYALTGVTGLLGRNLFFEIIKDNLKNLQEIEIIIFGRASGQKKLEDRIKSIFNNEGINYLALNTDAINELNLFLETRITYINIDFSSQEIISSIERKKLLNRSINNFFHIAASTDFRDDSETVYLLNQQNVVGTAKLLKLCSTIDIKVFSYVSSAYASGCTYGDILPNFTNLNQKFRNHYEKTKLQGELLVQEYQKNSGVRCRIFRPSTIAGKLIEDKKGEIYKFDVFYGWAFFFLKLKIKSFEGDIDNIYDKSIKMNIRIAINPNAGLNIVPVDFAAKVLYQVCKQNLKEDYFHLVNNNETSNAFYLGEILDFFNITGYSFVNKIPEDLNSLEKLYYKTVGSIFTPYIIQKEMNFNTDNLKELYNNQNLHCPEINQENFQLFLEFAKSKNFGYIAKKAVSSI